MTTDSSSARTNDGAPDRRAMKKSRTLVRQIASVAYVYMWCSTHYFAEKLIPLQK
jgi:hypothetical protein